MFPDGQRLHLQHGPIDMIVQAEGTVGAISEAYRRAAVRFDGLLQELVDELPHLRQPVTPGPSPLSGAVAQRMWHAAQMHLPQFVTPMAGVAGAGAQAILAAMVPADGITRAHVNNGGDIALYLGPGAAPFRLGVVVDPARPTALGRLAIGPDSACRGVATSGAHGRSHSMGIADSVTVLAADAPAADVAATLLANAVDLPGDPAIRRTPAARLSPDSDLGDRPVTTGIGPLSLAQSARALDAGEAAAARMCAQRLILGAVLVLGAQVRIVGEVPGIDAMPHAMDRPRIGKPLHA